MRVERTVVSHPMQADAGVASTGFGAVVAAEEGAATARDAGPLREAVAALFTEEAEVSAAVDGLASGERYDQAALLEVQAQVYRHAQRMDVATRVVDRSAAALRQLLNTQL